MPSNRFLPRASRAALALSLCATGLAVAAQPAGATFPGRAGTIVFASDRDGTMDVWSMNPDGTGQVKLTKHSAADEDPTWSPDGGTIAFVSDRTGDFDLWLMNADGTNLRRIEVSTADERAPSFSPDGSQVVFQSSGDDDGDWELWVVSLDGTGLRKLTDNVDDDTDPDWSPDGTTIAFSALTPSGDAEVATISVAGGAVTNLTNAPLTSEYGPSWSPDGTRIAFSSDRDGFDEDIFAMQADGSGVLQWSANDFTDRYPVWSPDGTRLAYSTDLFLVAVEEVVVLDLATLAITPLSLSEGSDQRPDWGSNLEIITRIAGDTRITTAVAVAKAAFPLNNSAKVVVLARSDDFPDALAGTVLAANREGAVLLTPTAELDPATLAEVNRLLSPGRTVYILGGTVAISQAVEDAVVAAGYEVVRLAGENRFATATAIAAEAEDSPTAVFVAAGLAFPDAIVAGVAAATAGGVVVLAGDGTLPAETVAYLDAHPGVPVYAIGGSAAAAVAAAGSAATALVGTDRFDTAKLVAEQFFDEPNGVAIASGRSFPDGLSGGVLAVLKGWPLLLTEPTSVPGALGAWLDANAGSVDEGVLFGGTAAVSEQTLLAIRARISAA